MVFLLLLDGYSLCSLLQFDQHAVGALRVQEGDQSPVLRLTRRLVEQFDPLGLEFAQRRLDILDPQADVVDPFAALLDEFRDGARRIHRLDQFDRAPLQGEKGDLGLDRLRLVHPLHGDPQEIPEDVGGLLRILHRHADMFNLLNHGPLLWFQWSFVVITRPTGGHFPVCRDLVYRGIVPCFLPGRSSVFPLSCSNSPIRQERISFGSMIASIHPSSAAT